MNAFVNMNDNSLVTRLGLQGLHLFTGTCELPGVFPFLEPLPQMG